MRVDDKEILLTGTQVLVRAEENPMYASNGVVEKANVNNNYLYGVVVKTGPGLILPSAPPPDKNDLVNSYEDQIKRMHLPVQCKPGDQIFIIPDSAFQFFINGKIHYVVREDQVIIGLRDKTD